MQGPGIGSLHDSSLFEWLIIFSKIIAVCSENRTKPYAATCRDFNANQSGTYSNHFQGSGTMFHIVTYTRYVCGSVTNNSTWIRIGYRIYSLWRFITTQITITSQLTQQLTTKYTLNDLTGLITATLLNTGFRLLKFTLSTVLF
jgi:hypothetical protein